jgi:hypothetical protein
MKTRNYLGDPDVDGRISLILNHILKISGMTISTMPVFHKSVARFNERNNEHITCKKRGGGRKLLDDLSEYLFTRRKLH